MDIVRSNHKQRIHKIYTVTYSDKHICGLPLPYHQPTHHAILHPFHRLSERLLLQMLGAAAAVRLNPRAAQGRLAQTKDTAVCQVHLVLPPCPRALLTCIESSHAHCAVQMRPQLVVNGVLLSYQSKPKHSLSAHQLLCTPNERNTLQPTLQSRLLRPLCPFGLLSLSAGGSRPRFVRREPRFVCGRIASEAPHQFLWLLCWCEPPEV